jgi:preprotein translocase subunit YajC
VNPGLRPSDVAVATVPGAGVNRVRAERGGTIVCRSHEGSNVIVVVYLVVLVAGFFFLVVRPQRRQMAARRALIASVGVGDGIVTTGGIHGTVRRLGDETIELEIAPGVVVTLARGAIAGRLADDGFGATGGLGQLRSGAFEDDEAHHDLPDEPDQGRPDAAGGAG